MSAVDRLSEEQRTLLQKCPTDRLRARLVRAGQDEEQVFAWDRPDLLEAMAEVILASGEEGATKATVAADPERLLKEREIMLKERDLQLKEKKERRRREDKEEEERRRREEREIADQRWRDEMRLRQQEIERQQKLDAVKTKDEKSLVGRTRKFAEAIKHVFPDMPTESAELPMFFDSVENLFKLYEIPADLQSKLLLPRLSGKAKAIVNKLSLTDLDSYEQIKKHLLCEFRLTPRELRSRFTQASKRGEETYALFAVRLENLLLYYLRSRDADKDVKKMFDLMIADKLKDSLPAGALQLCT
jgi:hypothetical protein